MGKGEEKRKKEGKEGGKEKGRRERGIKIYTLNVLIFREERQEREKKKHQFVVPLIYAFIG